MKLLIKFSILAFILLIFKRSLLSYLSSHSGFSWLQHLLKAFCRSFEHYCPLLELALFPLESVFTIIYLRFSLLCCKSHPSPTPIIGLTHFVDKTIESLWGVIYITHSFTGEPGLIATGLQWETPKCQVAEPTNLVNGHRQAWAVRTFQPIGHRWHLVR